MQCPFCLQLDTRVIDSRLAGEGQQIRRRRECIACKERFTSYEKAELHFPHIVKSDGRREPFKEDKLKGGILRAIEKRPVEMESVESAVSHIKHKLRTQGDREVPSRQLGDWVMEQLHGMDQVAYVRFASVYKRFEDTDAFVEEIEQLRDTLPPKLKKDQFDLLRESDGKEN